MTQKERSKKYYEEHKEERLRYQRAYAASHKEEIAAKSLEKGRKYRATHRKEVAALSRGYAARHPEQAKARDFARYHNDPAKEKARVAKWQVNNPDKVRLYARNAYAKHRNERLPAMNQYSKQWSKENPDKRNAITHRHRARKRAAGGSYTAAEWRALKYATGNRCLCCGKPEPDIKLTVDHVMPVAQGGINAIGNIQPLCGSCNSSKNNKNIDYRQPVGRAV